MCASVSVFARNPHILAGPTLESKECVPLQRMGHRVAVLCCRTVSASICGSKSSTSIFSWLMTCTTLSTADSAASPARLECPSFRWAAPIPPSPSVASSGIQRSWTHASFHIWKANPWSRRE